VTVLLPSPGPGVSPVVAPPAKHDRADLAVPSAPDFLFGPSWIVAGQQDLPRDRQGDYSRRASS
jgi:hypothetical protein